MDRRICKSIENVETKDLGDTVFGTIPFNLTKHNHGRKHKRPRGHTMAKTTELDCHLKPIGLASRFLSDTEN